MNCRRGPRASGGDTSQLYLVPMGEVGNVRTVEGGAYQRPRVEKAPRLARVTPAGTSLDSKPILISRGEGRSNPLPLSPLVIPANAGISGDRGVMK